MTVAAAGPRSAEINVDAGVQRRPARPGGIHYSGLAGIRFRFRECGLADGWGPGAPVRAAKAYRDASRWSYAAVVAKRRHRRCAPDPDVLLAQLRCPDEQARVKALYRICPCAAGFLVYERFRGEVRRLQKDPSPSVRRRHCMSSRTPA
jgi:hypothetical protein